MSFDTLLFDVADNVATMTLNRPDKLNAFVAQMHAEIRQVLDRLESGETGARCLLITGAGRGFCSGQDLTERRPSADGTPTPSTSLVDNFHPMAMRLRDLEMPVVAAVNGVAAGAGASLALNCDIVLAAKSARFIQVFERIGLVPDVGSTYFLPRLVGQARAMGLAMLAEPITGEQAESWGMIWRAVEDDALMDEATIFTKHLATRPTVALAGIKRAIRASFDNGFEAQLALEAKTQAACGLTADNREGINAFLEKRQPAFQGR